MYSINDIKKISLLRHSGDQQKLSILQLTPDFIDAFSVYFSQLLLGEMKKQKTEMSFLNFWKLSWDLDVPNNKKVISSHYLSVTVTRGITTRFTDSNEKITTELLDYFATTVSNGKQHIELIKAITEMAKNDDLINPKLRKGNNVAFLFRETFKSILVAVFENKKEVIIPGIGSFKRGHRVKKKNETKSIRSGVLQMTPTPNLK